ncbi:hypothetical protein DYB28_000133 [Aphanomyces astaci]|uniref:Anaphase-promoting complex subunit 4 WD40 domain-containing protein n=1 Tax=Aphanomyces astaci TaxID=112090 RepID=A0A9X8HAN1_APHAT|nr:hypothetical protein DYB28_000133 [Aphanomyces astaci]
MQRGRFVVEGLLSRSKCVYSDRFIPSRTASNLETTFDLLPDMAYPSSKRSQLHPPTNPPPTKNQGDLSLLLQREYLGVDASLAFSKPFFGRRVATDPRQPSATTRRNLFRFQSPRDHLSCSFPTTTPLLKRNPLAATSPPLAKQRKIAKSPFKILDAPALQDDFYLNLVDWSSTNVLAVGLGSAVYLWSSCTSKVTKLCELGTIVTSVAWSSHGTQLAIGTHHGDVQLWDAVLCLRIRVMTYDSPAHIYGSHGTVPNRGHTERVGTLAWNSTVLASGSRYGDVCFRHALQAVDTGSQVCNLVWSKNSNEVVSTHGYSLNQIIVWKYPSMAKVATLTGHTYRVLYLAMSPNGQTIVTGAGDETLRFWNAFAPAATSQTSSLVLPLGSQHIR